MDSELRRSYEEIVGATRGALEALMPKPKRRSRRRQEIAQKLQAQMGQEQTLPESELARYVSSMARDLRSLTPSEEEPRAPGELL